jgi:isopenicillin-N epimerase
MRFQTCFSDSEGCLMQSVGDPANWSLQAHATFLNHGSFGSCPKPVLAYQQELRRRMERQPVHFFMRDLEPLLDKAREALGLFLGADPEGLAFVPNATYGINAVLRALVFKPGDELMITDHAYNACRNALDYVAERSGAVVRVVRLPAPVVQPSDILERLLGQVTSRVRLLLIDHVTSPTAIIFPLEEILQAMRSRGIATLVDGAHAPGMIPLDLEALGATYYTGNCHKWMCAPKGAGFLYVRKDCSHLIRPLAISHGANATRKDRSRFQLEFGWTGTSDPTAFLAVPRSIQWMAEQLSGGWDAIMHRNRRLALAAMAFLQERLGWVPVAPVDMIGSMVSLQMPPHRGEIHSTNPMGSNQLQDDLWRDYQVEVPLVFWPRPPHRLLRISAQLYNCPEDYLRLVQVMSKVLAER